MTRDTGPEDEDATALIERLQDHLVATEELPVSRESSPYLGEAAAIATDLATHDPDPNVVRERVGHVQSLLAEITETGHPEADEHVATARDLAARILNSGEE